MLNSMFNYTTVQLFFFENLAFFDEWDALPEQPHSWLPRGWVTT